MSILEAKPVTGAKTTGIVAAGVFLVGAVIRAVIPSGPATNRGPGETPAATLGKSTPAEDHSAKNLYADELRRKIKDSFGCAPQSPGPPTDDWDHWNVPQSSRDSLRSIVAFVPDPVHTHLSLLFDRDVEALQLAVQQHTDDSNDLYAFDRSILPWQAGAKKFLDSPQAREAAYRERLE